MLQTVSISVTYYLKSILPISIVRIAVYNSHVSGPTLKELSSHTIVPVD